MPKKRTIEDAYELFKRNNFILLEDIYINSKTKMRCKNLDGYEFMFSYGDMADTKTNKNNCKFVDINNPFSSVNIQLFLSKNNSETILLNKYIDEKSKLKLKCKCGCIYETNWNHIRNLNNIMCKSCAMKKAHEKRKLNDEKLMQLFKTKKVKLIEYDDAHHIVVEDSDGYKHQTSLYNIDSDKKIKFGNGNKYTVENMKKFIENNSLPININFEKIKWTKKNNIKNFYLPCICNECESEFFATWEQITLCQRFRCKKCTKSQSKLESIFEEYLNNKQIRYVKQKTFINCKVKKLLPFDFYLYDYNCVVEIHGRQHYYENNFFTRTLEQQKEYDCYKKEYCYNNDILFLEIPYYSITDGTYKNKIDNMLE